MYLPIFHLVVLFGAFLVLGFMLPWMIMNIWQREPNTFPMTIVVLLIVLIVAILANYC